MDAILILGAAVWPDGPSPTLRRRTLHAAKLWHDGYAPLIVPCGGLGRHPPSEAEVMRQLLVNADVSQSAILLEDQSTTTLENIRNAKPLLPGPKVIIVTDAYHGRRALMVARHLRLQAVLSAPDMPHIPLKQRVREVLALPAYAVRLRRVPRGD